MNVTATTDKEVSDDEHLDLGEHRVTRETARDETGAPYEFYRCVDCGKEQVDRAAFTDEAVGADKCDGVVVASDGGIVLDDEETDECEECAELDGLPCFECYMKERGHGVGGA